MSTPETANLERRSSISISENSKGEPAVTVKVYSHDAAEDLDRAREPRAIEVYKATRAAVR